MNPPTEIEIRNCKRKAVFMSRKAARRFCREWNRRHSNETNTVLNDYFCKICEYFHTTKAAYVGDGTLKLLRIPLNQGVSLYRRLDLSRTGMVGIGLCPEFSKLSRHGDKYWWFARKQIKNLHHTPQLASFWCPDWLILKFDADMFVDTNAEPITYWREDDE
jgi:hypothetical protein